jgi:hypothetical protein
MAREGARVGLLEYEQELNKVNEHNRRIVSRSRRRLVPAMLQEKGAELLTKLRNEPRA